MKEILKHHIIGHLGQEPAQLDYVLSHFRVLETRKNEVLLEANSICRHVYFVARGCLKVTAYDRNGDEATTDLVFEEEWRTAMRSFVNQHYYKKA